MKIITNPILPPKGFSYINLFGVLFTRRKGTEISEKTLRHETIHTQQMKELWYLPFYIIYVVEWLNKLIYYRDTHEAYRNIGFEREAYANEEDPDYLEHRKRFAWVEYV